MPTSRPKPRHPNRDARGGLHAAPGSHAATSAIADGALDRSAAAFFAEFRSARLHWAVTARGPARAGSYGGWNLAAHVGDDPERVSGHRRELAEAFAVPAENLRFMNQVHGSRVAQVGSVPSEPPTADALITDRTDLALAVLVADCVPVILADTAAGFVGVVHAGRAGVQAQIIPATVAQLRQRGADQLQAWVGPAICARCYPVPAALRAEVSADLTECASVSWTGAPALDLTAGVLVQLGRAGVPAEQLPGCTAESEQLYSYRRQPVTGRIAAVVRLLPSP